MRLGRVALGATVFYLSACANAVEVQPAADPDEGSSSAGSSDPTTAGSDGTAASSTGGEDPSGSTTAGTGGDDEPTTSGTTVGDAAECGVGQWSASQPEPGLSAEIEVGQQLAWEHDEGHAYGVFHTFDELSTCEGIAPRKVHVFLPRDYADSDRDYPVVYMNDGNTAFWPGGIANKSWDVAARLSELDSCEVEPVIVVAVHPRNRNAEYTHTPWGDASCCGIETYADYLGDCLKPFIDENYRTRSERESTVIAGSSHGGLAAFLVSTLRPESFGNAIAMSPSFWAGLDNGYGGGPLNASLLVDMASPTLADPFMRPRLWIDWGLVRDGGDHNAVTEALATERGEEMVQVLFDNFDYQEGDDLFLFVDDDGGHDEDAWSTRIGLAIETLFPAG